MIDAMQFAVVLTLGIACGWGATLYLIGSGYFQDDFDKLGRP